jgi:hypothetical protein
MKNHWPPPSTVTVPVPVSVLRILLYRQTGDHPENNLTKHGYIPDMQF